MIQNPQSDPVVDEIHRFRSDFAAKFNGDLKAMLEDARLRQLASGRLVWKPQNTQDQPAADATKQLSAKEPEA